MSEDIRAALLKLADDMESSPYETADCYGWQVRELAEKLPAPPPTPEPAALASGDEDPAYRVESHTCAWEYVPGWVDGAEWPEWRCVKRWSDGSRCHARTTREELMVESRWAIRV